MPGKYRLCIRLRLGGELYTYPLPVDVRADGPEEIELDPGAQGFVHVVVKTPSGVPHRGTAVFCVRPDGERWPLKRMATGRRESEFAGLLPTGPHLFVAEAPGSRGGSVIAEVVADRITEVEIALGE